MNTTPVETFNTAISETIGLNEAQLTAGITYRARTLALSAPSTQGEVFGNKAASVAIIMFEKTDGEIVVTPTRRSGRGSEESSFSDRAARRIETHVRSAVDSAGGFGCLWEGLMLPKLTEATIERSQREIDRLHRKLAYHHRVIEAGRQISDSLPVQMSILPPTPVEDPPDYHETAYGPVEAYMRIESGGKVIAYLSDTGALLPPKETSPSPHRGE